MRILWIFRLYREAAARYCKKVLKFAYKIKSIGILISVGYLYVDVVVEFAVQ